LPDLVLVLTASRTVQSLCRALGRFDNNARIAPLLSNNETTDGSDENSAAEIVLAEIVLIDWRQAFTA
jgi:hypothetical protein